MNKIFRYKKGDITIDIVLGDSQALSNPEIVILPYDSLTSEITLKRGFDNDFPFGLQLADVLEVTFDFLRLKSWDSGFADALEKGGVLAPSLCPDSMLRVKNSFLVPNTIQVKKDSQVLFWGAQEKKPEAEYTIEKNQCFLKITFVDVLKFTLQQFMLYELPWEWSDLLRFFRGFAYDYRYSTSSFELAYFQKLENIAYIDFGTLFAIFNSFLTSLIRIFTRNTAVTASISLGNSTYFVNGWKFYTFKQNSARMESDVALGRGQIYIIWAIWAGNRIIGGWGSPQKQITGWDFLRKLAENFLQKGVFLYSNSALSVNFTPFFSLDVMSLNLAPMGASYTLRKNKNWIGSVKQQNEEPFEYDFQTLEYIDTSAESDRSIEIEVILSNAPLGNEGLKTEWKDFGKFYVSRLIVNEKGLYYVDGDSMYKVSDRCYLDGWGTSSLPDEFTATNEKEFLEKLLFRKEYSLHQIIEEVGKAYFCRFGNFELEFEYDGIVFDLGRSIYWEPTFFDWNDQYPVISSVEIDLYRQRTKVKLFGWKDATP